MSWKISAVLAAMMACLRWRFLLAIALDMMLSRNAMVMQMMIHVISWIFF